MHLAVEQGQKPLSVVITAGQRGDSPQFEVVLEAIRVPRLGLGRPRKRPDRVRADKAATPVAIAPTCADEGSRPPSRFRRIGSATASSADRMGGVHRRSTRTTTSSGTRSSAGSTGSSVTGPSPPGTTNSPSATKRPCWSQPSTSGCDQHFHNRP
ncbi:hypothetical protein ACF1BE_31085 [Streptomyces sp. NPDC014991]|uniref:hypothetical protein n=1 Tax=Streptomyces sp. NPDC014991 TaxID=3364935 RepID=UPI0036F5F562